MMAAPPLLPAVKATLNWPSPGVIAPKVGAPGAVAAATPVKVMRTPPLDPAVPFVSPVPTGLPGFPPFPALPRLLTQACSKESELVYELKLACELLAARLAVELKALTSPPFPPGAGTFVTNVPS